MPRIYDKIEIDFCKAEQKILEGEGLMQLIFYYNVKDRQNHKGVNFSPEYDFSVLYDNNQYTISQNEWKKKTDIFKTDNIISVAAVIGENGSGKTTLFKNIMGKDSSSVFDRMVAVEQQIQFVVVIENDGKLYIYHKIEDGSSFQNKTSVSKEYCKDLSGRGNKKDREDAACYGILRKTTIVYLTNSYYEKWASGISSRLGPISSVSLSPKGVSIIANDFYRNHFGLNDAIHEMNEIYFWNKMLFKFESLDRFQDICDLVYYQKLCHYDIGELNRKLPDFKIKFASVIWILQFQSDDFLNDRVKDYRNPWDIELKEMREADYIKRVLWTANELMRFNAFLTEENEPCKILYLNLLFEMCLNEHMNIPSELKTLDDVEKFVRQHATNVNYQAKYRDAIKEIEIMLKIAGMAERVSNSNQECDLVYDSSLFFRHGTELYNKMLSVIEESFLNKNMFLLKYIMIEEDSLSSGERALQQFLSWINLLPEFQCITGNNIERLEKNILFLIDEMDLYLHPEWQRKFLKSLLKELKLQFAGYKIQVIFSTHSPLCLSDIPVENTVYLRKEGNRFCVEDRGSHKQTFGGNIFDLLNDAFFLEGAMGEFASNYVNNLLQMIYGLQEESDMDFYDKEKQIRADMAMIGNKIVTKRLEAMLDWVKENRGKNDTV